MERNGEPSSVAPVATALESSDWQLSAATHQQVLSKNPERADVWVHYGDAMKGIGDLGAAESAYRRAISLSPKDGTMRLKLGHVLKLMNRQLDALAAYRQARTLDPKNDAIAAEHERQSLVVAQGSLAGSDRWQIGMTRRTGRRNGHPTLVFYPDYTITNSYQNDLYTAFGDDVEVLSGTIDDAIRRAADAPVVFHLHWPEPLFARSKTRDELQIRIFGFFRKVELLKSEGGRLFWTAHDAVPHDHEFGDQILDFYRRLILAADLVHVHNESAIEYLERLYDVSIGDHVVIRHGSFRDTHPSGVSRVSAREEFSIDKNAFVFCFVGQLRPYKGLQNLFDAFIRLQEITQRRLHLLVAGKPVHPTRPGYWETRALSQSAITMHEGFVPDERLQYYLAAADIMVLPYKAILTSGSVYLAADFGKPIITPSLPTLAEVNAAKMGPIYDPQDPDGLLRSMQLALEAKGGVLEKWAANASAFADGGAWPILSATLKEHVLDGPITRERQTERICGREVDILATADPVPAGAIGVAVVNFRTARQAVEACRSLPTSVDSRTVKLFVLDNSVDSSEVESLSRSLPDAEVIITSENTGYAAGNNILLARMSSKGCEFGFVINPDIRVSDGCLTELLLVAATHLDSVVAPVVQRESGHVSFAGAMIKHSSVVELERLLDNAPPNELPDQAYEVDVLEGSAFILPLRLLPKTGFIPEDYFLYFEESEWFLSMADKGVKRVIAPRAHVVHLAQSHGSRVPQPYYIYYLLRNAFNFNERFGGNREAVKEKYTTTFVAGWRAKLQSTAPSYLPIFEAAVRAAFEDGMAGIRGKVDLAERIDAAIVVDSPPGVIDWMEPNAISGWYAPTDTRTAARNIWLFVDDMPVSEAIADRPRDLDGVKTRDGFRIAVPLHLLCGENRTIDIREGQTGRRLAFARSLSRKLQNRWRLKPSDFSPLHALGSNEPKFRGDISIGVVNGLLRGWVVDLNMPGRAVYFDLEINGHKLENIYTTVPRPDLALRGFGSGLTGFEVQLPRHIFIAAEEYQVRLFINGAEAPLFEKTVHRDKSLPAGALSATANNYDSHFSPRDFMAWAFVNRHTPLYAYEESMKLQAYFERKIKEEIAISSGCSLDDFKVSIIMPVYNRANIVAAAIESVIAQTYSNWELMVIDDGSEDNSTQIIEDIIARHSHCNIVLIRLPENVGVSAARNRGLAQADGEFIAYLDSDNLWRPEFLQIMVGVLRREPQRRCAYCGMEIWLRNHAWAVTERVHILASPYNRSKLEVKNYIDLNVFVHRVKLFDYLGGFREDMNNLEDWELILRYTKDNPPIFVPTLLTRYFFDKTAKQLSETEGFSEPQRKVLSLTDLRKEFGVTQ